MVKGCAIFFAVGVVCLMVFCAGIVAMLPKPTPEQIAASRKAGDEYHKAQNYRRLVEEMTTERLKSPSTAKFNLQAGKDGENYVVKGYVDSQNGFGAMTRTNVQAVFSDKDVVFWQVGDSVLIDKLTTPR